MHNCGSIKHKIQFWYTCVRPVHHTDTHTLNNQATCQWVKNKVQRAKPCLPNQICNCSAVWFNNHFRKFYSSADWLKIHFLSLLTLILANPAICTSHPDFGLLLVCQPHLTHSCLTLLPCDFLGSMYSIIPTCTSTNCWIISPTRKNKMLNFTAPN